MLKNSIAKSIIFTNDIDTNKIKKRHETLFFNQIYSSWLFNLMLVIWGIQGSIFF